MLQVLTHHVMLAPPLAAVLGALPHCRLKIRQLAFNIACLPIEQVPRLRAHPLLPAAGPAAPPSGAGAQQAPAIPTARAAGGHAAGSDAPQAAGSAPAAAAAPDVQPQVAKPQGWGAWLSSRLAELVHTDASPSSAGPYSPASPRMRAAQVPGSTFGPASHAYDVAIREGVASWLALQAAALQQWLANHASALPAEPIAGAIAIPVSGPLVAHLSMPLAAGAPYPAADAAPSLDQAKHGQGQQQVLLLLPEPQRQLGDNELLAVRCNDVVTAFVQPPPAPSGASGTPGESSASAAVSGGASLPIRAALSLDVTLRPAVPLPAERHRCAAHAQYVSTLPAPPAGTYSCMYGNTFDSLRDSDSEGWLERELDACWQRLRPCLHLDTVAERAWRLLPAPGGLLVSGASGSGRSAALAAAGSRAAAELGVHVLHVRCRDLAGAAAPAAAVTVLQDAFIEALDTSPCLVMLDDLDSLVPAGARDGPEAAPGEAAAAGRLAHWLIDVLDHVRGSGELCGLGSVLGCPRVIRMPAAVEQNIQHSSESAACFSMLTPGV